MKPTERRKSPVDEIVSAYRSGFTPEQIAANHDIAKRTVESWLVLAGELDEVEFPDLTPKEARELYAEGYSKEDLATYFGTSVYFVNLALQVESEEKETFRRLYWDEGLTQKEIGERLDVSTSEVSNKMRAYGIPTRPRSGRLRRPDVKKEDVQRDRANGMTFSELAEKYNCSKCTIERRLEEEEK